MEGHNKLGRVIGALTILCVLNLIISVTSYAQFRRRYHGIDLDLPKKTCSMEIRGAEVSDVLRAFADQYSMNIVFSPSVSGKIDLALTEVPVQEAFLTILRSAQLAYIKEGDIFRIMSLENLSAENKLQEASHELETRLLRPKYASAKRLAESMSKILSKREDSFVEADDRTNFLVIKDTYEKLDEMEKLFQLLDVEKVTQVRPIQTDVIELKFIDTKELGKNISPFLSDSGKVETNEKANSLIVSDLPENLGQIKHLINKLDRPSRQVLIEARVVETSKSFSRALGVQWGGNYKEGPPSGKAFPRVSVSGIATGGDPATADSQNFAVNLPIGTKTSFGGIGLSLGHLRDKALLDIQLTAMEEKGEGRILSTPKIATLDNTKALIEIGARIPYRTYDTSQASSLLYSVVYVDAFTRLSVTPHITSDDRIKLQIVADKDRPDFSNTVDGNPLISRKGAQTELIVQNGETTVIGGLSISDSSESRAAVPWFADLPIIGNLFKNKYKASSYDELLIFITPQILEN